MSDGRTPPEQFGDRRQHEHVDSPAVQQRRGELAQPLAARPTGWPRSTDAGAVAAGDGEGVGAGAAHAQPVDLHRGLGAGRRRRSATGRYGLSVRVQQRRG